MNPDTNQFEQLRAWPTDELSDATKLLRPNGEPVPKHWSVFKVGENVVIKDYTFCVAYMNAGTIVLEPVGPVIIGEDLPDKTL